MLRNPLRSSTGKNPRFASAEYKPGVTCPLESTNLSLPSQPGLAGSIFISLKYSHANSSALERLPPGWPAPALKVLVRIPSRILTAASSSSLRSVTVMFISFHSNLFRFLCFDQIFSYSLMIAFVIRSSGLNPIYLTIAASTPFSAITFCSSTACGSSSLTYFSAQAQPLRR